MIIKRLEVKGPGKDPAIVKFEAGLNVIAGASDTGKSYITKCFQFIFGTEKPPKPIKQAAGYTHLEVLFEETDGSRFVLTRELKDKSDVTCTEIDNNNLITVLKPSHKGTPNLSEFFLKKIGLSGKVLAKGLESMNHASLTLRIFERVFLVGEERIISESSPFGKGQNTEKTLEMSFVKTLLTGNDDVAILETKENKSSKNKVKKKLDNLKEFLDQFFPCEKDVSNSLEEMDEILEKLESTYKRAEKELNFIIQSNNALIQERDKLIDKAKLVSKKFHDDTSLLDRFKMLEKKYISDRERLEANSEAVIYLEQQKIVSCPLCGNEIDQNDEIDTEVIIRANLAEILKIDAHLTDLGSTQKDIQTSLEINKNTLASLEQEISQKDSVLGESIGCKLKENRGILHDLDLSRSKFLIDLNQEKKRQEIYQEIGHLQKKYEAISDNFQIGDFSKEALQLSKKILEILKRWDFPNGQKAAFDIEARDITIDGKPRSHFGKGYRAICFSAILLGLMEFLYPKGRHPGFIILDSPLTTYKKQDEAVDSENIEVFLGNNLIYAFYRDLCDYYDGKQIIVLDNQEPDEDLYSSMNYTHFSGNESVGRYGFFPM